MQSDTASLGSYLRQERERRRVALHDISAVAPSSTAMLSSTAETRKPLVLQAQALQATWLRVKIDGTAQNNDVLLASGKSISWEAAERFVLTVGNANGVRVSLNGQEIALPPSRSNVVRDFLLTRQLLN